MLSVEHKSPKFFIATMTFIPRKFDYITNKVIHDRIAFRRPAVIAHLKQIKIIPLNAVFLIHFLEPIKVLFPIFYTLIIEHRVETASMFLGKLKDSIIISVIAFCFEWYIKVMGVRAVCVHILTIKTGTQKQRHTYRVKLRN